MKVRIPLALAGAAAIAAGAWWALPGESGHAATDTGAVTTTIQRSGTSSGAAAADVSQESAVPLAASRDASTIPAAELPLLLAEASSYQRAILEDGVVTREEYERAFEDSRQCTIAATVHIEGYVVGEPASNAGQLSFGATAPTQDILRAGGAEYDRCHWEYFRYVASGWGLADSYARLTPLWADMAACMNERGVPVPADADWRTMQEAAVAAGQPRLVAECTPPTGS